LTFTLLQNAFHFNFVLIKESLKNVSRFPQKYKATVFKFDNNKKCFLRIKSTYYNSFWRSMWHWRLENQKDVV